VSRGGALVVAKLRIHVGIAHAGRTLTVETADGTRRVWGGCPMVWCVEYRILGSLEVWASRPGTDTHRAYPGEEKNHRVPAAVPPGPPAGGRAATGRPAARRKADETDTVGTAYTGAPQPGAGPGARSDRRAGHRVPAVLRLRPGRSGARRRPGQRAPVTVRRVLTARP
jgi:hypothetical protein